MGDFPRTVEEKARKYLRVVLQDSFYVESVHETSCDIRIKPKSDFRSTLAKLPDEVELASTVSPTPRTAWSRGNRGGQFEFSTEKNFSVYSAGRETRAELLSPHLYNKVHERIIN